jgi:hypothetical protein
MATKPSKQELSKAGKTLQEAKILQEEERSAALTLRKGRRKPNRSG